MAGLLTRLARAVRNKPERRDVSGFSAGIGVGFGGFSPGSGNTMMSAILAEQIATISSCVSLISATIGSLPVHVYKTEDDSRIEVPRHPVARLLRTPNERQSGVDFLEWLTSQILLHGNGLALVDSDGNGQPIRLTPIPWPHCIPLLLDDRRLAFDVIQLGPWGGSGLPRRVLATEVLHCKERSDDSYLGRSRISRCPQTLQAALGLAEFSTAIWNNALTPSGSVTHPGKLNAEAKDYLRQQLNERNAGASNAKGLVVLDEGMSFVPWSGSPEDSQVLESRRFSTEDCARVMGVPLPLCNIWDHSSFTNSATASQWFGTFTILPLVRKIEAELKRSVFADPDGPFHVELDISGLMRGDSTSQRASNVADVAAGIMTRDEARRDLGLNPLATLASEPNDSTLPGTET